MLHDAQAITRSVDVTRDAGTISIHSGDDMRRLSLSALAAALLLVDEAQGRPGTRTVWMRRGTRDPATVPVPPPLPVLPPIPAVPASLPAADARRIAAAVRLSNPADLEVADCYEPIPEFDVSRLDSAVALDASEALVFVTCWRGACQDMSLLYRVARHAGGEATRVVLPPIRFDDGSGGITRDMLLNAGYEPTTRLLSALAKGRGIDDGGHDADWRFDGREFHLAAAASSMMVCGGLWSSAWPVPWRTDAASTPHAG